MIFTAWSFRQILVLFVYAVNQITAIKDAINMVKQLEHKIALSIAASIHKQQQTRP